MPGFDRLSLRNFLGVEPTRIPEELLDLIEAKGREIAEALVILRGR
jgi:hypothetical protein